MHINNYFICLLAALFAFFTSCSQTVSAPKQNAEVSSENEDEEEQAGCEGESGEPWDGTTAKEFACGNGSKKDPYIILTAEQLARLSFLVGDGDEKYLGKYYKLGADIILNKGSIVDSKGELSADSAKLHKWTPIGNSKVAFSGNFDGDGRSISGMFINTTSTHNGLFGNIKGTVQNLTVENGWVSGGSNTAGVVGYSVGILKDVNSNVSVAGSDDCTGGIVGNSNNASSNGETSTVKNVVNEGVVTGKTNVGGVIGCGSRVTVVSAENYARIEGEYYVGGVIGGVGVSDRNNLKKMKNQGRVSGRNFVGGVAGRCGGYLINYSSGESSAYLCTGLMNYPCGKFADAENRGDVKGNAFVGGVLGLVCLGEVSRLGNYEEVEGDSVVAGVVGYVDHTTSKSLHNTKTVDGRVTVGGVFGYNTEGVTSSAYNVGSVKGDTLVGLMIGYNFNTTMADYYYLKRGDQEPFGMNDGGGVATPKSEKEMKSREFAELLGDDFVYDEDLNDGYPVLDWEMD